MTEQDPAIRAALHRAEQQELERLRRTAQAEAEQQQAARDELEAERRRREFVWMTHGGSPEDFDKAWPEIQRGILMERQKERDRKQANSSVF